jgi:hypothetical protein
MLLARKVGRTKAQALVVEILKKQNLREGLAANPETAVLLTPEEIENIDCAEGYLGSADIFRRRLLGEN